MAWGLSARLAGDNSFRPCLIVPPKRRRIGGVPSSRPDVEPVSIIAAGAFRVGPPDGRRLEIGVHEHADSRHCRTGEQARHRLRAREARHPDTTGTVGNDERGQAVIRFEVNTNYAASDPRAD